MSFQTLATMATFLLVLPTTAMAQVETVRFEILPDSQYTYLPSALTPPTNVDGCTVDADGNLRCDFAIAGLFDLQIDPNGPTRIVDAALTLSGNNQIAGRELTSAAGVETFLEDLPLVSVPSTAATAAFGAPLLLAGPVNPISLIYDTPGTGGTLTGGFRQQFAFSLAPGSLGGGSNLGEGVAFQVNLRQVTTSVPEPTSFAVIGCGLMLAGLRRRRSQS